MNIIVKFIILNYSNYHRKYYVALLLDVFKYYGFVGIQ